MEAIRVFLPKETSLSLTLISDQDANSKGLKMKGIDFLG